MNSGKKSDEQWEKIPVDKDLVTNALNLAERDIRTAKDVFDKKDYDWSFSIAYNAMLQAGRALMFSEGYRPKGEFKHVSVIEFTRHRFGDDFTDKIMFQFNKIRKKRHIAVYEQVDIISEDESSTSLQVAQEFLSKVKSMLNSK